MHWAARWTPITSAPAAITHAGITCLSIPFGTALGVATFMVLGKPSVQSLFNRSTAA